jgi:hypothetical protein
MRMGVTKHTETHTDTQLNQSSFLVFPLVRAVPGRDVVHIGTPPSRYLPTHYTVPDATVLHILGEENKIYHTGMPKTTLAFPARPPRHPCVHR